MQYYNYLSGFTSTKNRENISETELNKINYDKVSISIYDNLAFQLLTKSVNNEETGQTDIYDGSFPVNWPLFISHQDAGKKCYSKSISEDSYFSEDMLFLNRSVMIQHAMSIFIYIHESGQLSRNIGNGQIIRMILPSISNQSIFTHHISDIEVLHKRANGKVPCDHEIDNEDQLFREMIVKKFGCLPSYWKYFFSSLNGDTGVLLECSRLQYQKLRRILSTPMDKNGLGLSPCVQIKSRIDLERERIASVVTNTVMLLQFKYDTEHGWYKKIVNKREFSVETLFGQIGGFVGMNHHKYYY